MTLSVTQGSEIRLPAEFFDEQTPADPGNPVVTVLTPSGDQVVTDATPERVSAGVYRFSYRVPDDAPLGTWKALWTAVIDGDEMVGEDFFEVLPAPPSALPVENEEVDDQEVPVEPDQDAESAVMDLDRDEPTEKPKPSRPTASKRRKRLAVAGLILAVAGLLLFNRFRDREPLPPAEALREGLTAHKAGDLAEAQHQYADTLRGDPNNKYALFNLGIIAQQNGELRDAVDFYEQSLRGDPNFVPALFNLAITHEQAGNHEESLQAYQKVLSLDPDNAPAHLNLGFLMIRKLDRQEEGQAELRRAVELNPGLERRIPDDLLANPDGSAPG